MIVIDIETTGIIPWKNSIIDIGAIDFNNPDNRFSGQCLIREGAEISIKSLEINGYDIKQITENNDESFVIKHNDLITEFIKWTEEIDDRTPCSQNPRFDVSFLMEASQIADVQWTLGYRSIDLHTTAYNWFLINKREIDLDKYTNASALSLDRILEIVNLPAEPKPHKAINGASLVAEAYSRLVFRKNLLREYKSYILSQI